MNQYVLITPAKNEEANIAKTIESIIAQTVKPAEWVIVSDGSTDRTDEIVKGYCDRFDFIKFIRNQSPPKKDYSSKVNAFNKGFEALKIRDYSFIGNLDADVSFEPIYFERILSYLLQNPKLGIAGGRISEVYDGKIKPMKISSNSVAGAVQLFRRECFEAIGGYIPIKTGGIDSAAEISARAHGWIVKTFFEHEVFHHGRVLTGKSNMLMTHFQTGIGRYKLGYHPLFFLFTCIGRSLQNPVLLGSFAYLCGYLNGVMRKYEKILPNTIVDHLRSEQLERLQEMLLFKRSD